MNTTEALGFLPPQAIELEEVILGACMLDEDALISTMGILTPDMLYKPVNVEIFKAICRLSAQNKPVDILTVTEQLKTSETLEEVGGSYYVSGLTDRVGSSANIEYHCRIVQQKYFSRKLIEISYNSVKEAYKDSGDILELMDDTAKKIISLLQVEGTPNVEPANRITKAIAQIERAMQTGNHITGIKSGINDIDKITGGWQNQDLIVIAARPGAGKSALALEFARSAVLNNVPTWYFSLEMSDTQLAMRELGREARVRYSKLRKGEIDRLDFNGIMGFVDELSNRPLYVDSSSRLSISILRTKLLKAIHEKGIKFAIIDYLNLMESEIRSTNTVDKISEICKELKRLAKQLDIPIILLAQLNRDVEKETDKRPKLHHLKGSGAIEEYSDMVMFLYRPAYYHKDPNVPCMEPNTLYIEIAKHKQGAVGDVKTYCEIEKNIITDWTEQF